MLEAFRHLYLDQDFRAVGTGEELLLHNAHSNTRKDERYQRYASDQVLAPDRPSYEATQALITGRGIDGGVAARLWGDVGQQLDAKIRGENHRYDPGGYQREADDPEYVSCVLSRCRTCKANGHQAYDCHECAGQHRRGGVAPGIGRSFHPLHAFFHLHHHHLDRDNGIVHEQAQSENERIRA